MLHAPLAPHPALPNYYTSDGKRAFVDRVFDRAATDYDRVENWMAMGSGRWYRREALLRANLAKGMRVLDVAVGTGLVAREAVAIVGDPRLVVGLDPSMAMMRQAQASLKIQTILGLGESIPLGDSQFDFVSMGYALRHLSDIAAAAREFYRVLKPGGHLCILEITRPRHALQRWAMRTYMRYVVPTIARLSRSGGQSKLLWQYYWDTIEACVPSESVVGCLKDCGFVDVQCKFVVGMFAEINARRAE